MRAKSRMGRMSRMAQPISALYLLTCVVFLCLIDASRDQARSLSHYENLRPFHDAFYRFVEPTSVTPYTY